MFGSGRVAGELLGLEEGFGGVVVEVVVGYTVWRKVSVGKGSERVVHE